MKVYSIALCRVSTVAQKEEGHSLETQEDNVQKAADALNAPIVETWSIPVSSRVGKNENRKDLKAIIEYCKTHKAVKYLIIDVVDRFMRDVDFYYYFKVTLKLMGVKIYYATDTEINSDNYSSRIQENIKILQAEMSNRERMVKCKNGLMDRVKAGYYPFNPHPGYKKTDTPGLNDRDDTRFFPLQVAVREVLSREFTPSEALKRLNDKGYRTIGGNKLQIDKFMKILKDPFYAGIIQIKDWPKSKGLHTSMISWVEHEELQEIINGRKIRPYKKGNPDFPLNRIMTCECSGKLTGFMHRNGSKKGWVRAEYRCRSCGRQYTREIVNAGLNNILIDIKLDENKKEDFLKILGNVWREEERDNVNYISTLEKRLAELEEKKGRLVLALANNPELQQDIKDSIEKVKKEITVVENQINEAKNIEKDLIEFIKFSLEYTNNLEDRWWELEFDDRVKCKELLFPQGFSINYNKKVYTPQISPLYRFVTNKKEPDMASDSLLVELRGIAPLSKKRSNNC